MPKSSAPLDTIEYWYTLDVRPRARPRPQVRPLLPLRYLSGSTDDHDDEVTEARWVEIERRDRMLAFKDERRMIAMAREALSRVLDAKRRREDAQCRHA